MESSLVFRIKTVSVLLAMQSRKVRHIGARLMPPVPLLFLRLNCALVADIRVDPTRSRPEHQVKATIVNKDQVQHH